ncbi:MAG: tetratricopeptide repeat protein [Phenylobacterium sp.]|uniref:tetratricopeptide repeat protein n=1 Tax=Phenylobacterium sp. TaxID=1871053 RepID=UPI0027317B89|nr:tetratricopeptide repeat protein [Phenylobacterium sp.]MDP2008572.1 tetratricopeptide repeat protein [Phenylobacterium sp.]
MTRHLIGGVAALTLLAAASGAWPANPCFSTDEGEAAFKATERACAALIAAGGAAAEITKAHVARSYALADLGRREEALAAADAALALSPDHLPAMMARIHVLSKLDRVEDALATAASAITAHPGSAEARTVRGLLWQHKRSDPERALADFNAAIAADPRDGLSYFYRANLAESDAAALSDLDKAAELEPENAEVRTVRGDTLRMLGRAKEALADYDAALMADPRHEDALAGRVFAKVSLNDQTGAARDAEMALRLNPNSATAQFASGYVLEDAELWDQAAAMYEAAAVGAPDAISVRLGLARVRHAQGKHDAALAALNAAEAIEPQDATIPYERARVWASRGEFAKAVTQYDIAIARKPSALNYHMRGFAHSDLKNYKAALADFTKASELMPTSIEALLSKGDAEGELGLTDLALASYRKALAIDPDYVSALTSVAAALVVKGDLAGAGEAYERALKIAPNESRIWIWLGEVRRDQGDYEAALKLVDRGLKLNPKSQSGLSDRADMLNELGRPAEALKAANAGLALFPEDEDFLYLRSGAHIQLGDLAAARKDLDLYLQRKPDGAGALNRRGEVHRAEGRLDLARADFDQVIAVQPDASIAYYNRALVSMEEERYDRAIKDFNQALALLPGDPDILSEKAETYRRMDDNLLAVETADLAIKANPKLAFAWHVRSLAKQELGDAAGAAADLAQAKRLDPTIK